MDKCCLGDFLIGGVIGSIIALSNFVIGWGWAGVLLVALAVFYIYKLFVIHSETGKWEW